MANIAISSTLVFAIYLQTIVQMGFCNSVKWTEFYINRDFEDNLLPATRNVFEQTYQAISRIHCASMCSAVREVCAYFKFDKEICYIFSINGTGIKREIALTDVFTMKDNCKNDGYKKYAFVDEDKCVRCYPEVMGFANATDYCSKFQARLLKLDTKRKQLQLQDEQAEQGIKTAFIGGSFAGSEWLWIDGDLVNGGPWAVVVSGPATNGMLLTLTETGFGGTAANATLPFCCEENP